MKRVLLSILLVLNILCLNAQEVRFISVNESIDSVENIYFKKLPKLLEKDTLRPDTLTTSTKWMLKLQKKLSKQQDRDSNIYIFFCPSSQDSVTIYLPLSGKYGYVLFDTAKTGVVEIQTWQKKISIYKYQWDLIHDPQKMLFAWAQDEEEGAYIYEFLGKKYEALFDKIYSKNYTLNTEYFDKIQGGETNNFAPEFTDDELNEFSDEEKAWIKKWEIRARKSSDVLLDVVDAIQKASAGDKISKIIAQQNKVYIMKCKFTDYDFNVAVYGHGDKTTLNKIFTKVVVGKIDDLFLEDNQKHLYVDVNEGRDYWIMALFEDGKTEPSFNCSN